MKRILALLNHGLVVVMAMWALFGGAIRAEAQFSDPTTQAPDWAQKRPKSLIPELRNAVWLVRAEAVELIDAKDAVGANMRITDVYSGPQQLVGELFQVWGRKEGFDMNGYEFTPPMALHEKGIFPIKWKPVWHGQVRTFPYWMYANSWLYGMDLPIREKISKGTDTDNVPFPNKEFGYKEAIRQAELIRNITELPDGELVDKLKALALNNNSSISAYAIRTLDEAKVEGLEVFLKQLIVNPRLPLVCQIIVDRLLVKHKYDGWVGTSERLKLLEGWVSGKNRKHPASILQRLGESSKENTISYADFLRLAKSALQDKKLGVDGQKAAIEQLASFGKAHTEYQPEIFDLLIREYRKSRNIMMKFHVAVKLNNLRPFAEEQQQVIDGLIASAANDKERSLLQRILKVARVD